jgi:aminoglycoside phosphotransferase (APT) family kinase protein
MITEDKIVEPIKKEIVQKFITKHFPEIKQENIQYMGGGSFSVFSVGEDFIFRFSKNWLEDLAELKANFEHEKNVLNEIRKFVYPHKLPEHQKLIIDKDIYHGGVWITKKFHGDLLKKVINKKNKTKIAKLLGNFLGKLHTIGINSLISLKFETQFDEEIRKNWFKNYEYNKNNNLSYLSSEEKIYFEKVYDEFLSIAHVMKPIKCLVHDDFDPLNCLIGDDDNYLQIIDCEDIGYGHAASDFCTWYGHYGEEFLDDMLSEYPIKVDKYFKKRVRFYWLRIPLFYFGYSRDYKNSKFIDFGKQMLRENMEKFKF